MRVFEGDIREIRDSVKEVLEALLVDVAAKQIPAERLLGIICGQIRLLKAHLGK